MPTPVVHEGNLHLYAVDTIADPAAPTVAEIGAGTDLTPALIADGFVPNHTENTVSTDMLAGFIRQSIGTEGVAFNLQFLRYVETGTDNEAWDYFDERGKVSHLVVSPYGPAEAGSHVEVYPVEFGRRKIVASGANSHERYSVLVTGTEDFEDDALVAV